MKNEKIWIIVPVFNRSNEIHNFLKDLFSQTYTKFQVVVVDHGTKNIDFSSVNDSRLKVIVYSPDLWWTAAINRGLEYALERKEEDDLILIINDDVSLFPDYLEKVVTVSTKLPDAIIGSVTVDKTTDVVLNSDARLNRCRAGYDSSWNGKKIDDIKDELIKSDMLSGRGMLIPESVIKKIGLFNEWELPHYGADNEFTWRAKKNGIEVFCSKSCIVNTLPKEASLYSYKRNFKDFAFEKKKPGNLAVISTMAYLCFSKRYAFYYVGINFIRFLKSYIKQYVMSR